MAGTITTPATPSAPLRAPQTEAAPRRGRKAAERRFIVPGEVDWEIWAGSDATNSHFVATVPSPKQADAVTALGLPASEVVTLPIWLATIDRTLLPEMVALQCEKRGVLNRARHDSPFDFDVVTQENNESLIRAQILPPTLSPDVCAEEVEHFDLACRFTPLPGQALLIWRELGLLCVAITRRHALVYAASLGEEQLQESTISQLFRLLSIAQSERWVSSTVEVVLRGTFSTAEEAAVKTGLSLQVRREARPAPWPTNKPTALIPESVRQSLLLRRKSLALQKRIALVAGIYLAAIAIWGGYIGWLAVQSRLLATKVNATAPQVQQLRSTALRWNLLQPAINPAHYPVEILYRCASVLPKEGIQLTLFEQRGPRLILSGESKGADSLGTVNALLKELKASKDLKDFTWTMPQPLLRDNASKFQIEGARATAHP